MLSTCRRALALPVAATLLALFATGGGVGGVARADGREARPDAAQLFDEGARAFDRGDFLGAAELFQRAYRVSRNVDTLWNMARSWDRAGDGARAATAWSLYLRNAPSSEPDRGMAQSRLTKLAKKLARLDLHVPDGASVEIDQESTDSLTVYVNPGTHAVVAARNGALAQQHVDVHEGDVLTVTFDLSAPTQPVVTLAAPEPLSPLATLPTSPRSDRTRHGWSPWVVGGGALLTGVAAGLTVWSGVETLGALDTFNAHPTSTNLSAGEHDQTQTNALLGASIGLACLTAATALVLVDWHPSKGDVRVTGSVGSVGATWAF